MYEKTKEMTNQYGVDVVSTMISNHDADFDCNYCYKSVTNPKPGQNFLQPWGLNQYCLPYYVFKALQLKQWDHFTRATSCSKSFKHHSKNCMTSLFLS